MGWAGIRVRSAIGITGFVVLVFCGAVLVLFAIVFAGGAPHALPSMPGLAAVLFLMGTAFVAAGVALLRRLARSAGDEAAPDARGKVRKRLYYAGAVALVVVSGAVTSPFWYAPLWPAKGSVPVGAYTYEPTLSSSCAENAHRIFYKGRVVTKVAGKVIVSPLNPSRILYEAACANDQSDAGTFYYAPSLPAPVQANPLTLYEIPQDMDLYWSSNDRFVIVPSYGEDTLLDLETGRRSAYLNHLFEKQGPDVFSSSASFLSWSPDGKRMAMRVHASYMHADRSFTETSELISVDPETLRSTYLGDMPKGSGIAWVVKDGSYEPTVVPQSETNR